MNKIDPEYRQNLIRTRLTQALSPTYLNIIDQGLEHKDHPEAKTHGGGHYLVEIVATCFSDKIPLERHRMIYAALGDAMGTEIHALSISAQTPIEAQQAK
jgi:BolA family transcriptional regulator, general stress-responsive regulator